MKKSLFTLALLASVLLALVLINACGDDDDDDDNEDDPWADFPATISGTMTYNGTIQADQIMIAVSDEWPMSKAPLYFTMVDIPETGFPFEYKAGLDRTGEYYMLALIDVDPDDGLGMNSDIDPLSLPEEAVLIVAGDNSLNFSFLDPDEIWGDDDDDDNDDTTPGVTGVSGQITYTGSVTGDQVVFGFYSGAPVGPPNEAFYIDVPGTGFPMDYEIDTEFSGDWKIVAYLDVDPEDSAGINFSADPNNWALSIPFTTIEDGFTTILNIELIDP